MDMLVTIGAFVAGLLLTTAFMVFCWAVIWVAPEPPSGCGLVLLFGFVALSLLGTALKAPPLGIGALLGMVTGFWIGLRLFADRPPPGQR